MSTSAASCIDKLFYLTGGDRNLKTWDVLIYDKEGDNYVKLGGSDGECGKPAGIYVGMGNPEIFSGNTITLRVFGVCKVRITESIARGEWVTLNPTITGAVKKARSLQEGVVGYAIQSGGPGGLIEIFVTCIPIAIPTGGEIREDQSLVKRYPEFVDFIGYDFDCVSENQYHESYGGEKHGVRVQINRVNLSNWTNTSARPSEAQYGTMSYDTTTGVLYQYQNAKWVGVAVPGSGGSGGVHNSLTNRDASECHPQAAIDGLTTSDSPSFASVSVTASYTAGYKVGSTAGGILVTRNTDASAADFTDATLTIDNAFHDLDLSSIVPANAKTVQLRIYLQAASAGVIMWLTKQGNSNLIEAISARSSVAWSQFESAGQLPLSSTRKIQYRVSAALGAGGYAGIVVMGWFL